MMTRSARRILSFLLAAGMLLAVAAPANAVAVTVCTGSLASQSIVGDVVVPGGATCTLRKVSVTGTVSVGLGAHLEVQSAAIQLGLSLQPDALAFVQWTTLRGDVVLDRANGLAVSTSIVTGSIRGSTEQLEIDGTRVNGRVGATRPDNTAQPAKVAVRESSIGQGLRIDGMSLNMANTRVANYLVVDQTSLGSAPVFEGTAAICSSYVAGDLTLKAVHSPKIGVPATDSYCSTARRQPVSADKSLILLGSTGDRAVLVGYFGKDLVCRNNNLLPQAGPGGVFAGGQYIQQCARFRPV